MNTSQKQLLDKTISTVGRAINLYGLIGDGDRIAVALSGGKDSLVLRETLALRRKRLPIDYDLIAVHVSVEQGFYDVDRDYLDNFCAGLNVPLVIKRISLEKPDLSHGQACFVCSKKRRGRLFLAAEENRCKKLALGHHRDDAIETLLMNMAFNGTISSMPPRLSVFNAGMEIIRPAILLSRDEIRRYAEIKKFPEQKKTCPYGENTRREDIKKIIAGLEKINPKVKGSIFKAMSNIHDEYLLPRINDKEKGQP